MNNPLPTSSCDCCSEVSRRSFLKTTVGAVGVATVSTLPVSTLIHSFRAEPASAKSETLVTTLYKGLSEEKRKAICFPFDDPLRLKVDNNWHITNTKVKGFNKDEQEL